MKSKNRLPVFLAFVLIVVFQSGCERKIAHYEQTSIESNLTLKNDKERLLAETFVEYWHLRNKREFKESYQYELPYFRYITSYEQYKPQVGAYNFDFQTRLIGIEYPHHRDDVVTVKRSYRKNDFHSVEKETWVYVNGKWYHDFQFSPFPE